MRFPLGRGTATRSEGEAPQGDVLAAYHELFKEPHEHPPPSFVGAPPWKGDLSGVLLDYRFIFSNSIETRRVSCVDDGLIKRHRIYPFASRR